MIEVRNAVLRCHLLHASHYADVKMFSEISNFGACTQIENTAVLNLRSSGPRLTPSQSSPDEPS